MFGLTERTGESGEGAWEGGGGCGNWIRRNARRTPEGDKTSGNGNTAMGDPEKREVDVANI